MLRQARTGSKSGETCSERQKNKKQKQVTGSKARMEGVGKLVSGENRGEHNNQRWKHLTRRVERRSRRKGLTKVVYSDLSLHFFDSKSLFL